MGIADVVVPMGLLRQEGLTNEQVANRYAVVMTDIFGFLQEMSPHGYLPLQVAAQAMKTDHVKLTIRMKVSDADHNRIQAEWHPMATPNQPPYQEA